jgi:hypothetical protein
MKESKESKKRTLTLSMKLNNDLECLCENLGVNVHSYLVNEIAKSVQRDSITLVSKDQLSSAMNQMLSTLKHKEV